MRYYSVDGNIQPSAPQLMMCNGMVLHWLQVIVETQRMLQHEACMRISEGNEQSLVVSRSGTPISLERTSNIIQMTYPRGQGGESSWLEVIIL